MDLFNNKYQNDTKISRPYPCILSQDLYSNYELHEMGSSSKYENLKNDIGCNQVHRQQIIDFSDLG